MKNFYLPAANDSSPMPAENLPDVTKVPSAKSFNRSKSFSSQKKTDESSKDSKQSKLPIRPKVQREQSSLKASSLARSGSTLHEDSRKSLAQPIQDSNKKNFPHALGSIPSYLRKKIGTTGGREGSDSRVITSAPEAGKQLDQLNPSGKCDFFLLISVKLF